MTIPSERTRAVRLAGELLVALSDPKQTPGVPKQIRDRARRLLRHYPSQFDLDESARAAPNIWWAD